jgi:hypothetical protein
MSEFKRKLYRFFDRLGVMFGFIYTVCLFDDAVTNNKFVTFLGAILMGGATLRWYLEDAYNKKNLE